MVGKKTWKIILVFCLFSYFFLIGEIFFEKRKKCFVLSLPHPPFIEDLNSPQISKFYSHSKNDNWVLDLVELIHHMIEDFFFCCLLLLLTDFLLPLPSLSLLQLVLLWY